jgi:hypothetical protein
VIAARRGIAQLSAVFVGALALVCGARLLEGCDGIVCSETATCSDAEGGGTGRGGPDAGNDSTADTSDPIDSTSPIDAHTDAGTDGTTPADTGRPGDATPDASDGSSHEASDGGGGEGATSTDACVKTSNTEDCTNGIDDDCNGAIDCADPHCQSVGFSCVPQWPGAGAWTAPVALYDLTVPGGPSPTPPSCAGFYASDVLDGHGVPVAPPAKCTCSCGPVENGGCTAPYASVWTTAGCTGTVYSATVVTGGGCTLVESTQDGINAGQILDAGIPSGSCAAALDASVPVWNAGASSAWAETGRVCAPGGRTYLAGAAGGCAAGLTCVEPAPATFGGGKICLLSSGQVSCPAGYGSAHSFYDGGTDTRACSDGCTCGAAAGVQCQAAVSLYSNGNCSGTALAIGATCTNASSGSLGSNNRVSATASSSAIGGQCVSSAGATSPTGGVTASAGVTTVCCQP